MAARLGLQVTAALRETLQPYCCFVPDALLNCAYSCWQGSRARATLNHFRPWVPASGNCTPHAYDCQPLLGASWPPAASSQHFCDVPLPRGVTPGPTMTPTHHTTPYPTPCTVHVAPLLGLPRPAVYQDAKGECKLCSAQFCNKCAPNGACADCSGGTLNVGGACQEVRAVHGAGQGGLKGAGQRCPQMAVHRALRASAWALPATGASSYAAAPEALGADQLDCAFPCSSASAATANGTARA